MSHMVESLKSLKWWWWWLSSHENSGNSSYMGLVVKSLSLSIWWHKSLKSSYIVVVEGTMLNHLVVIAMDEGRRWHIIALLHDRREDPMLDHLITDVVDEG